MSERTAAALAALDHLLGAFEALPKNELGARLVDDTQALRRAVAAFHMEAIRFRMHSVDRDLTASGNPANARQSFEEVRQALEAAGFHTRSHSAPLPKAIDD